MSPRTRTILFSFWEYAAFLANSLVFLLIGLDVNVAGLTAAWQPALWAIGGVLIARIIVVYGLSWIGNRWAEPLRAEPLPLSWQHVLSWGGLRGAISLALALSLPETLGADRELLRAMAFGVVLFTLLVQATTMRPLIGWLRIITRSEAQVLYETHHARLIALRAAEKHLDHLHAEGMLSTPTWEKMKPEITRQTDALAEAVREVLRTESTLGADELNAAQHELRQAQRSALLGLRRDGVISEQVFETLVVEVKSPLNGVPESLLAEVDAGESRLEEQNLAKG